MGAIYQNLIGLLFVWAFFMQRITATAKFLILEQVSNTLLQNTRFQKQKKKGLYTHFTVLRFFFYSFTPLTQTMKIKSSSLAESEKCLFIKTAHSKRSGQDGRNRT